MQILVRDADGIGRGMWRLLHTGIEPGPGQGPQPRYRVLGLAVLSFPILFTGLFDDKQPSESLKPSEPVSVDSVDSVAYRCHRRWAAKRNETKTERESFFRVPVPVCRRPLLVVIVVVVVTGRENTE